MLVRDVHLAQGLWYTGDHDRARDLLRVVAETIKTSTTPNEIKPYSRLKKDEAGASTKEG